MFIFQLLHNIIVIVGSSAIGIIGAFFVVSQFVYNVDKIENEYELDSDSEDFELMYEEEFKKLEIKELPSKEIVDTFSSVVETPSGKVIITYNLDEKTFYYYTDRRNIPIRFLDITAQKYVIDHDCRAFYEEEELNEVFDETTIKEPSEEIEEETYYHWIWNKFTWSNTNDDVLEPSCDDVLEPSDDDGLEPSEDNPKSVFATYKRKTMQNKTSEVEKIMNKYKFGGTMLDFNNKRESKNQEELEISFTKYKEMVKNKTEL